MNTVVYVAQCAVKQCLRRAGKESKFCKAHTFKAGDKVKLHASITDSGIEEHAKIVQLIGEEAMVKMITGIQNLELIEGDKYAEKVKDPRNQYAGKVRTISLRWLCHSKF